MQTNEVNRSAALLGGFLQIAALTGVFHSIVWWYLGEEERAEIEGLLERAGREATREAPLAWLRMEMLTHPDPEVRLRLWPPGDDILLALANPHGRRVRWGVV